MFRAVPCARRPSLKDRDITDLISGVRVLEDIELARRSGDHCKRLDGDIAVDESREIYMTAAAAPKKVAAPEQTVAVKICDGKHAMQRLGLGGRLVWRRVQGAIESPFDDSRQCEPCSHQDYDEQQENPAPAFHKA